MERPLRVEYPGAIYHVTCCGNERREIGNMIDVDYSTVSVSRKRLRDEIQKAKDLKRLLFRIEANLSKLKN